MLMEICMRTSVLEHVTTMKLLLLLFLLPLVTSDSKSAMIFKRLMPKSAFNKLFPERWGVSRLWKQTYNKNKPWFYPQMKIDYYNYNNFVKAIEKVSGKGLNKFLNERRTSRNDRKRELCAFMANIAHETGAGMKGLFHREEIRYEQTTSAIAGEYRSVGNRPYSISNSAVMFRPGTKLAGKKRFLQTSYHGRGPMQLSWGYNYGDFSKFYFGDPNKLLKNPDILLDNPVAGIASALWFWLANDERPVHRIPHNAIYKRLAGRSPWGFGLTIMAINGGLEHGVSISSGMSNNNPVKRRVEQYKRCAKLLKFRVGTGGEQLDTKGMKPGWSK